MRTPGIYGIQCSCGKVYIGQTGDTCYIRLNQPGKSGLVEAASMFAEAASA